MDKIWSVEAATWVIAIFTGLLFWAALYQLSQLREGQRAWATLDACNKYDLDPVLSNRIEWLKRWITDNKADPAIKANDEFERRVTVLLNFLEGIAIGYERNDYNRDIVKTYLGSVIALWVHDLFLHQDRALFRERGDFTKSYTRLMSLGLSFANLREYSLLD